MRRGLIVFALCGVALLLFLRGTVPRRYDVIVTGGTVYDGTGAPGRRADVGIRGDRIAAVGDLRARRATTTVDATGLAVAPGFINMLSWSTDSLIVDGRSQGEIRQGVTTQIFGEGSSMGPLTPEMKQRAIEQMGDIKYDITWTTLAEYLQELERRGVSQNVASFIGATTIREHVIGLEDAKPTPAADGRDARARPPGDGGGRARHRLVADLRAGVLRVHRGADRALQGRGAVPRQVHLAHAQRGQPPARRRSTS